MSETTSTSLHGPKLAEAIAIQSASFDRTSIVREQHPVTQVHKDALTKHESIPFRQRAKKKLAHGREVHDEKQQALSKKYKVSLEIAKMGRDALEEYLNEKSY